MTEKKAHNQAWPFPTGARDVEDWLNPRCYGCGHTYYDRPLEPRVQGRAADGGLCHWCLEEQARENSDKE